MEASEFGLWALVPPLLAIVLAIVSKQVIPSLFTGVFAGMLIFHSGNVFAAFRGFADVIVGVVTDDWNVRVILFTCLLGAIVGLIRRSGGFEAFGRWAETAVGSARGAQLTTWFSGLILFFDDYFDCLVSGSVMRPVTDQHRVSREKLAYLVDTTAASVATLIPLSTWVAFMVGLIGDEFEDAGLTEPAFGTFLRSIPFNLYAIGAIVLALYLVWTRLDYGPMLRAERRARTDGEIARAGVTEITGQDILTLEPAPQGRIFDMALPILVLVGTTIFGLLQTGGYFEGGVALIDAVGDADAATALMWATLMAVLTAVAWFLLRRLMPLGDAMTAIIQGIKAMLPALIILTLAWSIGEVADLLGLGVFVADAAGEVVAGWMVPVILFLAAAFIAFATGTSWGTFAIMIPVGVPLALATDASIVVVVGAVFGGGIFGDHSSPISDTTILSSTGASCNHIDHVNTQLPYAITAAAVASVGFVVAGLTGSALITLSFTMILLMVVAVVLTRSVGERTDDDEMKRLTRTG